MAAVVLDLGRLYTKYGFAGESAPRGAIRSNMWQLFERQVPASQSEFVQALNPILSQVFLKELQINPRERAVLVCEHILLLNTFKQALAYVLFETFRVPQVSFVPEPSLAIFASDVGSESPTVIADGMVLSCSYHETYAVPVLQSVPICKALKFAPLGLRDVHQSIHKSIAGDEPFNNPHSGIENILVQCCFVEPLRGKIASSIAPSASNPNDETVPSVDTHFNKKPIKLDGAIRGRAGSVLFDGDSEDVSVATLFLDSLYCCEPDVVKAAVGNVVLCGGGAMMEGFQYRLEQELRYHVLFTPKYAKLKAAIARLKFCRTPFAATIVPWIGGSVLGKVESLSTNAISMTTYKQSPEVVLLQDWTAIKLPTVETAAGGTRKKRLERTSTQNLLKIRPAAKLAS